MPYRILFLDDDPTRIPGARAFYGKWLGEIDLHTRYDVWGEDEVLPYDLISLDNDLGVYGDVIRILRKRFFTDYQKMADTFRGKTIVVHSCNPVASGQLVTMMQKDFAITCFRIPFDKMLTEDYFPWAKPE